MQSSLNKESKRERRREGGELAKVKSLTSKAVPPDHSLLISFMGGWINRLLPYNRTAAKMQVIHFIAAFPYLSHPFQGEREKKRERQIAK